MTKNKKIILTALLLAATIVLGRLLSIRTSIITIGFSFVPIIMCSVLLGWKYTLFVSTMSDLVGALIFPTGPYFVGFTISSLLTGLIYGIFLYRKSFNLNKKFLIKLFIVIVIETIFVNGILNTIWVIITVKNAANIVIPIRIIKQLIMIPVKYLTMLGLFKLYSGRINKLLND